jgi:hypothetical protein
MSAMLPKAEVNSEHERLREGRDSSSETGAANHALELSDFEWPAIKPMLPNKMRGVRRVNDRRGLNGIFWMLRSGAPWQSAVFGSPQRLASANDVARGPWVRCGLDQGVCLTERGMGKHSAEAKSQRPDLLQPLSVSRAQSRQAVLQQGQAMSTCRDPIRVGKARGRE